MSGRPNSGETKDAETKGPVQAANQPLELRAEKSSLQAIPCLRQSKISETWNPSNKEEQLCLLAIARDSLSDTLTKVESSKNPTDTLVKMFKNPASLAEAIGTGIFFELSENTIYGAFHSSAEESKQEDLALRLENGIKRSLEERKLMLDLDIAIDSPQLKEFFKKAKNNLSLEEIKKELDKTSDPRFAEVLKFLDNKFEFLMGEANRDYSRLSERPALHSHFGNGKGLSIERLIRTKKQFESENTLFGSARRILRSISTEQNSLFKNTDSPLKDIVPEAINQNNQSSVCVPMSVLASLAATERRAELKTWIKEESDGSVTVSLPGADQSTLIAKPSLPHRTMFNTSKDHGYWSSLLLQAFTQNVPCKEQACTTLESEIPEYKLTISGGLARLDDAIEKITGNRARQLALYEIQDKKLLSESLKDALDKKRVVIAAITGENNSQRKGIAQGHAYSVLKLEGSTVVLRDPMGVNGLLKSAGYIRLPLSEFSKTFETVAVESAEPLEKAGK